MKSLTVRLLICAVLLVLILGACTENGRSIYYILEHEKKQPSSTIGKHITISDIAKIDTKYYAAAGAIFVGSSSSGALTWIPKQKIALPTSDALCNALVAFPAVSGNLYGGFITPGKNLGLYKAVGDDFASGGAVTDPLFLPLASHQVIRLISANGRLLIVTAVSTGDNDQPFNYFLTSTSDGLIYTRILENIPVKINDATFDGVNYWAVYGTVLYTDALLASPFPGAPGSNNVLQGISSDSGRTYISMKKKGFYVYDGASWTLIEPDEHSGDDVSYQGISVLPSSGPVIVGSNGYGLYYYKPGYVDLKRSDDSDIITLDLYDASISRFLVDTTVTPNIVLACTNGNGLWRGFIDPLNDAGVSGWVIQ